MTLNPSKSTGLKSTTKEHMYGKDNYYGNVF